MLFPRTITVQQRLIFYIFVLFFLVSCSQEENNTDITVSPSLLTEQADGTSCINCHAFNLDAAHDIGCTTCHNGNDQSDEMQQAHIGLIANPSHPDYMQQTCGSCHQEAVVSAAKSAHFTLQNKVNMVRTAFGADELLATLTDIPAHSTIQTELDLVDDLLRRHCLRCHVYWQGDAYPRTMRGTGCASCHLEYKDGELKSHVFIKSPGDKQCLSCHHSNSVGGDFHGYFEHDFNLEYRTPYLFNNEHPRPYGLEHHPLVTDIHQQRGMTCIDCHDGGQLMGTAVHTANIPDSITCTSCHIWQPGHPLPLANLQVNQNRQLILITKKSGTKLTVPILRHPAHQIYGQKVSCVVCHAQWTFNDENTHLVRHDSIDYFHLWQRLTTQGSFDVEHKLTTNLSWYSDYYYDTAFMTDKIRSNSSLGIWFTGYEQRRWESLLINRDDDGVLKIFRPILDLHLSYVNMEGEVLFDAFTIKDKNDRFKPYTPHTIGKAGAFFKQRLQKYNLQELTQEIP